MREKTLVVVIAAAIALVGNICFGAPANTGGGLIPPPAINIPYGGMIVTEINLSDNDVLGIIKQALPTIANTMQNASIQSGSGQSAVQSVAGSLDLQSIGQVIDGIKGVRFIIAKYDRDISPADMIKQFGEGIAKTGKFSKIASDFAFVPGVVGLYVQENNSGYMGFMYDHQGKVLYAARIVGSVDVPKLVEWASKHAASLSHAPIPMIGQKESDSKSEPANEEPAPSVSE
ncbi:MAG: hypothetical protein ACYC64_18485 [Armatimonadota bacterium]